MMILSFHVPSFGLHVHCAETDFVVQVLAAPFSIHLPVDSLGKHQQMVQVLKVQVTGIPLTNTHLF